MRQGSQLASLLQISLACETLEGFVRGLAIHVVVNQLSRQVRLRCLGLDNIWLLNSSILPFFRLTGVARSTSCSFQILTYSGRATTFGGFDLNTTWEHPWVLTYVHRWVLGSQRRAATSVETLLFR